MSREWSQSVRLPVRWESVVDLYMRNLHVTDQYRQNELLLDERNADKDERFVKFRSVVNPERVPAWLKSFLAGIGFALQIKTNTSVIIYQSAGQMMAVTRNETGSPRVTVSDRKEMQTEKRLLCSIC